VENQIMQLVVDMIKGNKQDAEKRFDSIEEKIDRLLEFKWRIVGITAAVSLFGGIIVQIIIAKIGVH
jgi:hypothetical protein